MPAVKTAGCSNGSPRWPASPRALASCSSARTSRGSRASPSRFSARLACSAGLGWRPPPPRRLPLPYLRSRRRGPLRPRAAGVVRPSTSARMMNNSPVPLLRWPAHFDGVSIPAGSSLAAHRAGPGDRTAGCAHQRPRNGGVRSPLGGRKTGHRRAVRRLAVGPGGARRSHVSEPARLARGGAPEGLQASGRRRSGGRGAAGHARSRRVQTPVPARTARPLARRELGPPPVAGQLQGGRLRRGGGRPAACRPPATKPRPALTSAEGPAVHPDVLGGH
jgi:hypothetical protein